jgi:hypothetical protein
MKEKSSKWRRGESGKRERTDQQGGAFWQLVGVEKIQIRFVRSPGEKATFTLTR